MPDPSDMALLLGLPSIDGASYVRYFAMYNNSNYAISLSGTGWNFPATNIVLSFNAYTFVYTIVYTTETGWFINCLSSGKIDLS
jgi:hypothetical protein